MKRLTKNLFYTALLLSFFLHLGAATVVYFKRVPARPDRSVEVTFVDKPPQIDRNSKVAPEKMPQQIVDQSEKRINDEIDPKAKYLSRFNQRVAEQTKAAATGQFQNDAKQGPVAKVNKEKKSLQEKPKQASNNAPKTKQKMMDTSSDGDVALPKMADLKPQFHWDKTPPGVKDPGKISQTDDFLKDLKSGPQTLLTTREFVYYSYYNRIKDRLRLFWEPKIKEKITRIFAEGRHIASDEEKITRLVITLDATGKLIRVQVLGESGLKDLDDAAIEAFQQAAPFPNPPKGIVEQDGTIKIRWDFILEA